MSRCFAFPPPGYEPKAGTGIIDFSAKEKHRVKKHKQEKREQKEKRDKDGSKDKPKEKKDQKHRCRKKEKDSAKSRTSEDIKAESQAQGHNLLHIKEHWQKTDEAKDPKFKEELEKRIRDDGAENSMFGNFRNSIPRKFEGVGGASEMENKKYGERSLVSNSVVVPKPERRKLGAKISSSSSLASARRRKDVFSISVEKVSINAKTEVYSMDSVLKMKMERDTGTEMFQVSQSVEKDMLQKVEGKNKTQGKEAEDRRLQQNSNHSVKRSIVEHNNLGNFGKKDQANTLNNKLFAAHKNDDESMKKRKCLDTNGFLRENGWPGKIPRMTSSSSQSTLNGRSLEFYLSSPSSIPLQSGAMNNLRQDRLLEKKERKINGTEIFHLPPLELKPSASGSLTKNSDVSLALLPHPESKYLSQVYAVPKMVELPEIDDQEWLFSCYESKTDLRADRVPREFAEPKRIESADVLALPYVVPF